MISDADREKAARARAFAHANAFRKRQRQGHCLHPKAGQSTCRGGITAAHTIQRRGGLATISDTTNHVLSVIPTLESLIASEGRLAPRRIGVNDASTFPGFCNEHDAIFNSVEMPQFVPDAKSAFLLAYRSVCMEAFRKADQLLVAREMAADIQTLDEQQRRLALSLLEPYRRGVEKGLADVRRLKASYDAILLSEDLTRVGWLAVEFDALLPIVTSGSFFPEYDFAGRPLQSLINAKVIDSLSLNITAFDGRSWCIFTWLEGAGPAPQAFAESFLADVPDDHKANAAICAAFEVAENTYIDPRWWEQRSEFQQARLLARTASGTPSTPRRSTCFQNYGRRYSTAGVAQIARRPHPPLAAGM